MHVTGFVICLNNEDFTASLELYKVYAMIAPEPNDPREFIRIVDESGEDYLYPAGWFESVSLGDRLEARLLESVMI